MGAVETAQVISLQAGDGLYVAIHTSSVRVARRVGQFAKRQRSHPPGVVGPLLQVGDDLPAQFIHFFLRKDRVAEHIRQNVQDAGKVLGKALGAKTGALDPRGNPKGRSHRFHFLINLIKGAVSGAAGEGRSGEGRQTGLLRRFVAGAHFQVAADHHRGVGGVFPHQDNDAVGKFAAKDVFGTGNGVHSLSRRSGFYEGKVI